MNAWRSDESVVDFAGVAKALGVPMSAERMIDVNRPAASHHRTQQPVACNDLNEVALAAEIDRLTRLMPGEPTMSEEQVAALLQKDAKTIQNRRLANPETVPPFVCMHGFKGVVYMRDDVIRFLAIQILNTRGRRINKL
jgi:hypothetical protein